MLRQKTFSGAGHWINGLILTVFGAYPAVSTGQPVYNPANGHGYERVDVALNWFDAKAAAEQRTWNGAPGHLATITSQQENDYIRDNLGGPALLYHWLGGFQPPGSPEPAGGWQWITGEPWQYTSWYPTEPNNTGGGEDGLEFTLNHLWNDYPRTAPHLGYVVEYEPVPSSIEVKGPARVAENFYASYRAIAHYDDGGSADLTALAIWTISPPSAGAFSAPGVLNTAASTGCSQPALLSATFTQSNVTKADTLAISILETGQAGTALSFFDDYVDVPNNPSLDLTTQVTMEVWFYADAPTPQSRLIDKGDGSGCGSERCYELEVANGWFAAAFFLTYQLQEGCNWVQAPAQFYVPNRWNHAAAVLNTDQGYAQQYHNGQLVWETHSLIDGRPIPPNRMISTHYPVRIGNNPYGNNLSAHARIDEVRLWDVARTPEQIQASLYRRLNGDEPGLVGYWRFDEGQGQTAFDLSPFGNHGRLGSLSGPDGNDPTWINSDAPIGAGPLPPQILAHPTDELALAGQLVTFHIQTDGDPPLAYQWRKGGVPLVDGGPVSGATTATLTINPACEADNGGYDVLVANTCGATASEPALLTVLSGTIGIDGPEVTAENHTTEYHARATLSDGSTLDVTAAVNWSITPATAGTFVAPGLLLPADSNGCSQSATLTAQAGSCLDTVSDTQAITILRSGAAGQAL